MLEVISFVQEGLLFYLKYLLIWHMLIALCLALVIGPLIKTADENLEKENQDTYESDELVACDIGQDFHHGPKPI